MPCNQIPDAEPQDPEEARRYGLVDSVVLGLSGTEDKRKVRNKLKTCRGVGDTDGDFQLFFEQHGEDLR